MELIINTDLSTLPQTIDFNHEALKAELATALEKYKSLVVTEESMKTAKSDKAKLNKLMTALEDKRKEVKKECLKPYESFEAKIKELTALIKEPVLAIDTQIKHYEGKEKDDKKSEIEQLWNSKGMNELLSFDDFFNPKWLNKTTAISSVETDINVLKATLESGVKTIRSLNIKHTIEALNVFTRSLDLSKAISEGKRLDEFEMRYNANVEKAKETETLPVVPQNEAVSEETVTAIDIRVYVTDTQKATLKSFLQANKIKCTSVPKGE